MSEVCFLGGGETGYPALLALGRSRLLFGARLHGRPNWEVEPVMTREMLDSVVQDIGPAGDLRAWWEGEEAVIADAATADRRERRLKPDAAGLYAVGAFHDVGRHDWTWTEIAPPWPGDDADSRAIVGLLTAPVPDRWPIANRIKARAGIRELSGALSVTDDIAVRQRICYLIGHREPGDSALAIPALVRLLGAGDPGLRGEAADAIMRIAVGEGRDAVLSAAPDAGESVFEALCDEGEPRTRALLAGALGALRHEPGIPWIAGLLRDDDWFVRREAAWSLAALCASACTPDLRRARERETDSHAAEAMRAALAALQALPAPARSEPAA
jgi:hypothetical protein